MDSESSTLHHMKFVRSPTGCLASPRHPPSLQWHPFPFRPHHIPYRFISKPCCRHLVDHRPSFTASSCHTRHLASRPSLRTMLSLEPYFIFIFRRASFPLLAIGLGTTTLPLLARSLLVFNPLAWLRPTRNPAPCNHRTIFPPPAARVPLSSSR